MRLLFPCKLCFPAIRSGQRFFQRLSLPNIFLGSQRFLMIDLGMSYRASACRSFAIGAACIGILAFDAEAAITFKDPFRSVSAGNNKGAAQAKDTNASGSFNESARVDWEEYWSFPNSYFGEFPNTTGRYFSTATQESIIGLTGIAARGSVLGAGLFDFYGQNPLQQVSQSYFRINILLDAPGNLYLNGFIRADMDPWGTNIDFPELLITLAGTDGQYYSKNISPWNYEDTFEHEINEKFISLPSGEYEFVVSLKTSGYYGNNGYFYDDETGDVWIEPGVGGYGNATYEITLVPEPSSMLLAALGGMLLLTKRTR
jgi:hypothetical protein